MNSVMGSQERRRLEDHILSTSMKIPLTFGCYEMGGIIAQAKKSKLLKFHALEGLSELLLNDSPCLTALPLYAWLSEPQINLFINLGVPFCILGR